MKIQLKFELYKLWKRRFVFISFVILLFFCVIKTQYFETRETKLQIMQSQEILEPLRGSVDKGFSQEIETLANSYKKAHPAINEQMEYEQAQLFGEPMQVDIYYQQGMEVYQQTKSMKQSPLKSRYLAVLTSNAFFYSPQGSNWSNTLYSIDLNSYYCIFLCIMIACSTIFSHDRESKVEEILLTTKEGRRCSIKAKLACSFLVTLGVWFIFTFIPILQLYLNYGSKGMDTSLSLYYPYNNGIPYNMITMFGWLCILSLLATLLYTIIILLITRKTNSMLVAGLLSAAFFAAPIILQDIPFLHTIAYMMPSFTARLLTSFGTLQGVQFGNIALLRHEVTILGNSIFLILFTIVLYHLSCSSSAKERGLTC